MKTSTRLAPAALAGVAVLAWAVVAAGEKIWVSADGKEHVVHARSHAMFIEDGGTELNLADLADGETRVIGEGAKQITARREGDEVTIERPARGEEPELHVTCRLPSDTCKVITFEDEPEKVMLLIQKERTCVNGVGDCSGDPDIDLVGEGGSNVIVHRIVCHGPDDCTSSGTEGGGVSIIRVGGDEAKAGQAAPMVVLSRSDRLVRRCPEGDTTMVIETGEKDTTYRCPKHGLELK